MGPFKWNHFSVWFYHSMVCFLLPKCVFFDFHHNIMFLWFLENSVGKKIHMPRMVWFSPPNAIFFTLAFQWYFTYTIEAPLSLRTSCKKWWGRCPWPPARAYAPRTLRTHVLKKWPPSQPFFAARTPQSVINLHQLLNMSNTNTHFDIFLKN